MTSERAAALAAARRHGMNPDEAGAQFRFREIALDAPESRARVETMPALDSEAEDEIMQRFIEKHSC
jgi:hypothetical protein